MNYAVILAGGVGTRMQQDIPKQYLTIAGKPVLVHTLERFEACTLIDRVIIVAHPDWRSAIKEWLEQFHITKFLDFADPGSSRQASVFSGLCGCMKYSDDPSDIVIVHEAARPLVSVNLIEQVVEGLNGYDACIPVLPINDSVIYSTSGDMIDDLIDRSKLFCGQAPECFPLHRYWKLNQDTPQQQIATVRADHELCFQGGWKVHCVPGEENNFKLTTPIDINRATTLISQGKV